MSIFSRKNGGRTRIPRVGTVPAADDNKDTSVNQNAFAAAVALVAPNTVPKIAGYLTATALATGAVLYFDVFSTDAYLKSLDPAYEGKCYSPHEGRGLKAPLGQEKFQNIISLMSEFGQRGAATAQKFQSGKSILCVGIDDPSVSPKNTWPYYNVYFMASEYRPEMMALYMASSDSQEFWSAKTTPAFKIKEFTPESGLTLSRAQMAVRAVENIRNYARALEANFHYRDDLTSPVWQAFLQENPTLQNTLDAYMATYKLNRSESDAMQAAMRAFMKDPVATLASDNEYLREYNHHVAIIDGSDHTHIYLRPGSLYSSEYALVDADRDGKENDLIELNWRNQATGYIFDYGTSSNNLRHKMETYDCSTTDSEGKRTYKICSRKAKENVYYEIIPHKDTASVSLNPETLVALANLTETSFLPKQLAQEIMGSPEFFTPVMPDTMTLMNIVQANMRKNIPAGRYTGQSAPGLGLR